MFIVSSNTVTNADLIENFRFNELNFSIEAYSNSSKYILATYSTLEFAKQAFQDLINHLNKQGVYTMKKEGT